MDPVLDPTSYVFASIREGPVPSEALMSFREAEGMTLIVPNDAVPESARIEFPCRRITLNIHSALEAVGFLAKITPALASKGMGVNPVSAFYHDHLFVPEGREAEALDVLLGLTNEARAKEKAAP